MIIKTITCHDVYNVGASLQAYALQYYLIEQGHEVEIIDYKPDYLSKHYKLTAINNPRFDKPFFKQIYILAKLPGRIVGLFDGRKKHFDDFRKNMLNLTKKKYLSNEDLKNSSLDADIYIAGSDQIWNPLFENGKDPAFFLDFVPEGKIRISYAASFAVDNLETETREIMQKWLSKFQGISVREKSGLDLIRKMGYKAFQVCDPVFLLNAEIWKKLAVGEKTDKYLFIYDFDNNIELWKIAKKISKDRKLRIISVFENRQANMVCRDMGPCEFINLVLNAEVVLSNSFHATAFSLIFHREFYVVNRREGINTRMRDILIDFSLEKRLVYKEADIIGQKLIDWNVVDARIELERKKANAYLELFIR